MAAEPHDLGTRFRFFVFVLACWPGPLGLGCGGERERLPDRVASVSQPILGDKWYPLGPDLITNGQTFDFMQRVGVTGRINVVTANPHNPFGDVWVGSATGGVWHGRIKPTVYWHPETDHTPSLSVGAVVLEPKSCTAIRCNTVWVGTGENGIRRDTIYGRGVLKGTFNASTTRYDWQLLGEAEFALGSITSLVLDPSTNDGPNKRLYVALSSGVTANASHSTVTTEPAGGFGIWQSDDAGKSWERILPRATPATDLEIDPQDPLVLYAGARNLGLSRSIDGGQTWESFNSGLPQAVVDKADWPELAVARAPGEPFATVYVVLGDCPHPHNLSDTPSHCSPAMYRYDFTAGQWQEVFPAHTVDNWTAEPLNTYTSYTHALTIHPTNSEILWYGGLALYRSHDVEKPNSWFARGASSTHPDIHDIHVWSDAESPSGVFAYLATDGGLYFGDGLDNWNDTLQKGLAITQIQGSAVSPFTNVKLIGTQDNGKNYWQVAPVWGHNDDSDGGFVIMDNDTLDKMYGTRYGLQPGRCVGAGCWTWEGGFESIRNGLDIDLTSETNDVENTSYYPPFVQAPVAVSGQHPLFLGTTRLYRSDNDGDQWTNITPSNQVPFGPPIPELGDPDGDPLTRPLNPITAIGLTANDSQRIYIGYYNGDIFTTGDGGSSWLQIDDASFSSLPNAPVTSIAVHPGNPARIFVSLNAFGSSSVGTLQLGGEWFTFSANNDVDNAFAKRPVNVLAIEPSSPHRMWAGTDEGIYSRADADPATQNPWQKDTTLPNVGVYTIDVDEARGAVFAGTHGRGMWALSTSPFIDLSGELCCECPPDCGTPPYILATGQAFEQDKLCTMKLFSEHGAECAVSSLDARGVPIRSDENGVLFGSSMGWPSGRTAIVATNSVWLKQGSSVTGDVVVTKASPGPTLAEGMELVVGKGVLAGGSVMADGIKVKTNGQVTGDAAFNELVNNGRIDGALVTPLSLPVATTVPMAPGFEAGSQHITLAQREDRTLAPGSYGVVTLRAGTASDPTVLTLGGGSFNLLELNLGDNSRVECGPGPCDVRIKGKLLPGAGAYLGPSATSGLGPQDVTVFVEGTNGATGNLGATPKAATIGSGNTLVARVYVPNGTLQVKSGSSVEGILVARDVMVGENVSVSRDEGPSGDNEVRQLIWVCYAGLCAGGVDTGTCPVREAEITCGSRSIRTTVNMPRERPDPYTSFLTLRPDLAEGQTSGSFSVSPLLKKNGGTSTSLCSETIDFSDTDTGREVLDRAALKINSNADCADAGVTAVVFAGPTNLQGEDAGTAGAALGLKAPSLSGVALLPAVTAGDNLDVRLARIGVPLTRSAVVPRITFIGAAVGGGVAVAIGSRLGICTQLVPTSEGESAETVATKVRDAFLAGSVERSAVELLERSCTPGQNPRAVYREGASVQFPGAHEITVRSGDPGISYAIDSRP